MIVIPAAGKGRRFAEAGYEGPKHMIPLGGVPLIGWVERNLHELLPGADINVVTADQVGETRGTAETILRAGIDPNEQVLIGNCDQLIKIPEDNWQRGDGVIFTFNSCSEAHSYVVTDEDTRIRRIEEKQVISAQAVSGVYWFAKAKHLLDACEKLMVIDGKELYLSYAIKMMLASRRKLYAYSTPTAILGTPEDFQRFEVAMEVCS